METRGAHSGFHLNKRDDGSLRLVIVAVALLTDDPLVEHEAASLFGTVTQCNAINHGMVHAAVDGAVRAEHTRKELARRVFRVQPPSPGTSDATISALPCGCSSDAQNRQRQTKEAPRSETHSNRRLSRGFASNPTTSISKAAACLGVSVGSVSTMLNREGYRRYSSRTVQTPFVHDPEHRFAYCDCFRDRLVTQPTLCADIILSDESTFYLNEPTAYKHRRQWCRENPRYFVESRRQGDVKVNVWCVLHGTQIIGPVFLPDKFKGAEYLRVITEVLTTHIEELPFGKLCQTFFQQDGAPPHSAAIVTRWLDETFPFKWIGRHGPVRWPPRSPDLTPMDFFLWGHLKRRVYQPKPATLDMLKSNIMEACHTIPTVMLLSVLENIKRRVHMCLKENGHVFEHLM